MHASSTHGADDSDGEEGMLVRAANLIGQLGDPQYLRKANALYYEFEEVGRNKQFGYTSPADLTDLYPKFYWSSVSAHIQSAIRYLNVTSNGRKWIANLHSNIFRAERELSLSVHNGETGVLESVRSYPGRTDDPCLGRLVALANVAFTPESGRSLARRSCPLWVKSRHVQCNRPCPL